MDFLRKAVKKLWRITPSTLQEWGFRAACDLLLETRAHASGPEGAGPWYVVGWHRSLSGLARAVRLAAADLRSRGEKVIGVDVTGQMLQRPYFSLDAVAAEPLATVRGRPGPGTVVVPLNPPQFQLALLLLGPKFLHGKRVVASWVWELEDIPAIWRHGLAYADEVCVPSRFVREAIRRHTRKPVTLVPYRLETPRRRKSEFLADGILHCLYIFDMASDVVRKNPSAAVEAVRRAFPTGGAELTLKVCQPGTNPAAFAKLEAVAKDAGARIVVASLSDEELDALYCANDVYLSLHRSEGYGLTIREAMLRGLHVVATGWSGNMDFMTGGLAHPVPYELVPVQVGSRNGATCCRWAEPDIDAAAAILRDLRGELARGRTSPQGPGANAGHGEGVLPAADPAAGRGH